MATKPPTSLENGSFIHDLHTWKKKREIFRSHVDFPWGGRPNHLQTRSLPKRTPKLTITTSWGPGTAAPFAVSQKP